VSVFGNKD